MSGTENKPKTCKTCGTPFKEKNGSVQVRNGYIDGDGKLTYQCFDCVEKILKGEMKC